ncbi:hypothetical protein STEG23_011483 [Scotinomys teguina]
MTVTPLGRDQDCSLKIREPDVPAPWFLDPGGWSKTAVVSLYFIFPGICTLSLEVPSRATANKRTCWMGHIAMPRHTVVRGCSREKLHIPWCMCGDQKITFHSQCSPSAMWVLETPTWIVSKCLYPTGPISDFFILSCSVGFDVCMMQKKRIFPQFYLLLLSFLTSLILILAVLVNMFQMVSCARKNDSVVTGSVVTDSVVTDSVVTDSVVTDSVVTDSVVTDSVVTDSVVTDSVVTDSVVTDSVVTGSVVTGSVVTGSVVTGSVVTGSVVTGSVVTVLW